MGHNQVIRCAGRVFPHILTASGVAASRGAVATEQLLFTTPALPSGNNYAGKEHPELAADHGRTVVVSYAQPTETFTGDVRLASVALP